MNQEPINLFNDYSSLVVASMSCNNKRKLRSQQNRKRVRNSLTNENMAKTQTTAQFTFKSLIKLFTGNHNQNNKQRDEIDENNKLLVPSALSLSSTNNSSVESTSSASSTHEHQINPNKHHQPSRRSSSPIVSLKNQVQRQSTLSNISSMKLIKVNLNHTNNNNNINNSSNNGPSNNTYGFTVVGYCPCQIGKVESNSLAQLAGLLAGDIIVKVNGKNVCRATCDSIAKMIK